MDYADVRSEPIPTGTPQGCLIDTEDHTVTWYLNTQANTLTVMGDLGGMPLGVTGYDLDGASLGSVEITETGVAVGPVIPRGAWRLLISWGGQSETVYLSELLPLAGDGNGNGKYDAEDAVGLLCSTVYGGDAYPLPWPEEDCDFDGNGVFDANDAVWLLFQKAEFAAGTLHRFIAASYEDGQLLEVRLFDDTAPLTDADLAFLREAKTLRFFFLDEHFAPLEQVLAP